MKSCSKNIGQKTETSLIRVIRMTNLSNFNPKFNQHLRSPTNDLLSVRLNIKMKWLQAFKNVDITLNYDILNKENIYQFRVMWTFEITVESRKIFINTKKRSIGVKLCLENTFTKMEQLFNKKDQDLKFRWKKNEWKLS